jgi:hypothetical protein
MLMHLATGRKVCKTVTSQPSGIKKRQDDAIQKGRARQKMEK